MSRVGKEPIAIPQGVKVTLEDQVFVAEGPKGKVCQSMLTGIPVEIEDGVVTVTRDDDSGDLPMPCTELRKVSASNWRSTASAIAPRSKAARSTWRWAFHTL